jgi:hypothetical protein
VVGVESQKSFIDEHLWLGSGRSTSIAT